MAEYSKDTLAIIDRLKKEGSYIRNGSGGGDTNSLKAIKIELRKFDDTFQAIREAMTGVQALSTEQSEYNKQKAERDVQLADLNEEELAEYKKNNADRLKREQALQIKAVEDKEKEQEKKKKENRKIFGKDGLLIEGIKRAFNFAFLAGLISLGYSAVTGFLEGFRPDLFGPDGKLVDLPNTVFDLFDIMTTNLAAVDWAGLAKNLQTLSDPNFLSNIGLVAGGVGAAALAGQIPLGDVDGPAGKATKLALKGGIAAALYGGINLMWPKVETYIYDELMGMDEEDIARLDGKTTLLDAAKYGIQGGMTMAVMFGSRAGLWGAVGGFVLGVGMAAIDYMNDKRSEAEDKFIADYAETMGLITKGLQDGPLNKKEIEELEDMHARGMRLLSKTTSDSAKRIITANLQNINKILLDRLDTEDYTGWVDKTLGNEGLKELEVTAIDRALTKGDTSGIIKLLTLYKAMNKGDTPQELLDYAQLRFLGGKNTPGRIGEYLERNTALGAQVGDVPIPLRQSYREIFAETLREALIKGFNDGTLVSQRTGSYGFKNFGNGTLALLHGEEAVITRNSLEGQILEGLRSGSTVNEMTNKIATAMEAGNSGSAPMIVNNVNNASNPISVQTSMGGARVAHTKIGGGGMGGSYIDMPGLIG